MAEAGAAAGGASSEAARNDWFAQRVATSLNCKADKFKKLLAAANAHIDKLKAEGGGVGV